MKKKAARRRRNSAMLAGIAALGLLVTGTLAWQSISQRAVNNNRLSEDETGARLHDDFAEDQDVIEGANKDVYVENYSGMNEADPDNEGNTVYVRVRLQEYMEIGEGAGLFDWEVPTGTPGASPGPADYQALDETGTGGVRDAVDENKATPVIATNEKGDPVTITDILSWPVHIPGSSVSEDDTDMDYYWDWTMGGSKVYMPTFNRDNTSLLTDRTPYAQGEFTLSPPSTQTANAYYADPALNKEETHEARSTLETADVVLMEDWIASGKPLEDSGRGYWVGDTDGWFYWSKALEPGEATGLLLDGIQSINPPTGESYYAIHVVSQSASRGDWGDEEAKTGFYKDGLTDNALSLLNRAAGINPTVTSINIQEGKKVFVKAGESTTLHADVSIKNGTGDPSETKVTWSIDPSAVFTEGKLTTSVSDVGKVYTVTASSAALPNVKSTSATVIVFSPEAEIVVGPQADGKYYMNMGGNTYREILDDGTISTVLKSAGADETIGNGDDQSPVTIGHYISAPEDDVELLGPNDDDSYYVAGPDGKLWGMERDETKVWARDGNLDDLITYNPDDTSYNLTITQTQGTGDGTNSVTRGKTIKYTTKLTKILQNGDQEDATDQSIRWELLGGSAGNTLSVGGNTIDSAQYTSGEVTLTIGIGERVASQQLKLRAITKEGTIEMVIPIRVLGETFTDDAGVEWKILSTDASGNRLVMTTKVYGYGTQYNTSNTWNTLDTDRNNLKLALQDFYEKTAGSDTKADAIAYESPLPDVRSTYGNWSEGENAPEGWSRAGVNVAEIDGSNAVFALSISEANEYLGNAPAGKLANDASDAGIPRSWWLRSPGASSAGPASFVNLYGDVGNGIAWNEGRGFRPALWLKP